MRILTVAAVLFLWCRMAEASFVGCPSDPAILEEGFFISDRCWSNVHAAVFGDFLLNKRLRPCRSASGQNISHSEICWNLPLFDIGWDIRERFSFHLLAGPAASVTFNWHQAGNVLSAPSHRGLFWSGSSKLIVVEIDDTAIGVDFHGGGIEWMKGSIVKNRVSSSEHFFSRLYFWQLAAGLSQKIGWFSPYVGAVANQSVCVIRSSLFKKLRFHDLVKFGMMEGVALTTGSRFFLNFEARQFFEFGITISGEVRF